MKNLIWIAALLIMAPSAFAEERAPTSAGGEIKPNCESVAEATTVLPSTTVSAGGAPAAQGEGTTAK
jgi:hypothetical protein